jgi:DNA-binding MurR/RpiR family transcriptional regulator
MYREKIREYYDHLSRSYRKVADYIMSNYYEVAFMTAAQLAYAVGVDTTTVVRFSQRLGYNGYPELLQDVREQVKSEIYAAYEPQILSPDDPAGAFRDRISQEQQNLRQMLVHNPPEHVEAISRLLSSAKRILLLAMAMLTPWPKP